MSSPKDDASEFIGNSDAKENHLANSDEKSSTGKGKGTQRHFEEDSKNHEKCILKEIATVKENKSYEDASVDDELEVISKPVCQAGEPVVNSELEIANQQKKVADEVQKQSDGKRMEEKENTDSVADEQNDDTLNASALEGNTSEYLECDWDSLSEDEILSYDTQTLEVMVGKISENVLQVFEERSLHKEKEGGSRSRQVSGGSVDEQNQDFEAHSRNPSLQNSETSTEDSGEVTGKGKVANVVDEENKDFLEGSKITEAQNTVTITEGSVEVAGESGDNDKSSTGSRMPQVQNAATSTEVSVDKDSPTNEKKLPVKQSRSSEKVTGESGDSDHNSFVDERNKNSSTGSTKPQVQNAATSTEVSIDKDSSPNEKKLPAKQSSRSSEEVTEIIIKYLNSKEHTNKLDKIDEIVKQLTLEEFLSAELSAEDLSPEDSKALKELYSQQLQKLATKRKSKLSDLDEDPEDLQAISKKCKLSSVFDQPFKLETSCCLEEQFRIAFKETSDDHGGSSQKEKEYRFPLTGSEQPRKFCKHQIAKIDAMVASAMSLDSYMSRLPDELGNPNDSTEEVYEDTPCCYHSKAQRSSSARTKDKILSGPQKSVPEKMMADSNEECSDKTLGKTKWNNYFTFEGALNSIKNLTLFVSFTSSLMVAMTVGKVFGVDFPVNKSKRKNIKDDSVPEFDTQ